MKSLYQSLIVLCACVATSLAQQPVSPLKSLVETELSFAKAAEVQGTREAFLSFIADDGILYRPGPVNGKQWMKDHPLPQTQTRNLLAWQPIFAFVSRAGDLGYTTGPWEYKNNIKDEKPSGFGNFVTVWKKQPDGSWKFVIDLGISHPMSAGPLNKVPQVVGIEMSRITRAIEPVNVDQERSGLLQEERTFSATVQREGSLGAYQSHAADDLRLFRNGSLPFVGKQAASSALTASKEQLRWEPTAGDVSRSGDLGYTYGTYEAISTDAKKAHGNYLHIWTKQGGVWRMVLDVTNPLPD
jgi:ketosteroid isomerase-like protein